MGLDIYVAFREMHPPAVEVTGKLACALAVHRLVDECEQESDQILFAYEDGIVWKATFAEPSHANYRIHLVSNELRCSADITVNDETIAQGQVRITFDRRQCRRKLTPVFVKRLWWRASEVATYCGQLSLFDRIVATNYRRRYRRGPIGTWLSSHDMLTVYGCSIEFRSDGTGAVHHWGSDEDMDEVETLREFRWRSKGDFVIDVCPCDGNFHEDNWGHVQFDFKVKRSPYGKRIVLMYSKGGPFNDDGFWQSPHPVELVG